MVQSIIGALKMVLCLGVAAALFTVVAKGKHPPTLTVNIYSSFFMACYFDINSSAENSAGSKWSTLTYDRIPLTICRSW